MTTPPCSGAQRVSAPNRKIWISAFAHINDKLLSAQRFATPMNKDVHHATLEQLLVLANIEGMNAELIHMSLPQGDRLKRLNAIAIRQMRTITTGQALCTLQGKEPFKQR